MEPFGCGIADFHGPHEENMAIRLSAIHATRSASACEALLTVGDGRMEVVEKNALFKRDDRLDRTNKVVALVHLRIRRYQTLL